MPDAWMGTAREERQTDRQTDVLRLTTGLRFITSSRCAKCYIPESSPYPPPLLSLQWGSKPGSLPCPGHFLFVVCEPVPALRFTALGIIQNKCSKQLPAWGEVILDKFNGTSKRDMDYNANGG